MAVAQARRDRRFVAAIRRERGADPSGLDPDGYGLCHKCRARRSKRPGVPRLICAKCEREVYAALKLELEATGRTWRHIQPDTPLSEIRAWVWGEKEF